MSFKRNVLSNYIGQLYAALIGIALVPLYVQYMGVEAYGLVGFFAMLQAWFMLLDIGLTPTMARATAGFSGGAMQRVTSGCRCSSALPVCHRIGLGVP